MIMILPLFDPDRFRRTYVKCPVCKRGRLCDSVAGTVKALEHYDDTIIQNNRDCIIVKCPKCANVFLVSIQ